MFTENRIAGVDMFSAEPLHEDGEERGHSWIEMMVQADGGEPKRIPE